MKTKSLIIICLMCSIANNANSSIDTSQNNKKTLSPELKHQIDNSSSKSDAQKRLAYAILERSVNDSYNPQYYHYPTKPYYDNYTSQNTVSDLSEAIGNLKSYNLDRNIHYIDSNKLNNFLDNVEKDPYYSWMDHRDWQLFKEYASRARTTSYWENKPGARLIDLYEWLDDYKKYKKDPTIFKRTLNIFIKNLPTNPKYEWMTDQDYLDLNTELQNYQSKYPTISWRTPTNQLKDTIKWLNDRKKLREGENAINQLDHNVATPGFFADYAWMTPEDVEQYKERKSTGMFYGVTPEERIQSRLQWLSDRKKIREGENAINQLDYNVTTPGFFADYAWMTPEDVEQYKEKKSTGMFYGWTPEEQIQSRLQWLSDRKKIREGENALKSQLH